MSEKMSEVYEAYDILIKQTLRGRGAILLKTDKGLLQIKQLNSGTSRLKAEKLFKEEMCRAGYDSLDRVIPNTEGELYTYDRYGNANVMRIYFSGRECDVYSIDELEIMTENLARFHGAGKRVYNESEFDTNVQPIWNFERKNQELRRVYNFVVKQKMKNGFERIYMDVFDTFYDKAVRAVAKVGSGTQWKQDLKRRIGYCHGSYNHHAVLINSENNETFTIGFDKFHIGNQLHDLYNFFRKTAEKNDYEFGMVERIIETYTERIQLESSDFEYLYSLLSYPEKFYKISNQYMNSSKTWISPKMLEKLERVVEDEEKRTELICQFEEKYADKLLS